MEKNLFFHMKTALIHDWLVGMAGGEKVLQSLHELYHAPIYTLIYDQKKILNTYFENAEVYSSFIQKLPFAKKHYRNFLFLFPMAIEQFDLTNYNLILSNSHSVAKGVITNTKQLHICYCNTPMRYAWDLYQFHLEQLSGIKKNLARFILHKLRQWDFRSHPRVDHFIANSKCVAERIKKIYKRESTVIYPPVNIDDFFFSNYREKYYFTCSRLVPYKRIDLLVKAFTFMPEKKLIILGDGPEMLKLKKMAKQNVEFLGQQPDEVLKKMLAKARAFLFAAEEDFGIVTVEAQASGVPVIAYGKGGSLETIVPNKTGLFFLEQTIESIVRAIHEFEKKEENFDPEFIKKHVSVFSKERFKNEISSFVIKKWQEFAD